MIAVIYPVNFPQMFPFDNEPIGVRTILREKIAERLARMLKDSGAEKVLTLYKEAKISGAISVGDALEEYVSRGDLILRVPDNFFPSEEFKRYFSSLIKAERETTLASISKRTPRTIYSKQVGEAYSLGIKVCSRGEEKEICGRVAVVNSSRYALISEAKDLLEALDVALSDIKETKIESGAKISPDVIIQGPVVVESGAKIYERTKIIGPTYIGKDVLIGNGSLIRRASINASSSIGFSSEVKHSVLEEYVSSGRLSYIGDSFIGRNTSIVGGIITVNHVSGKPKLGAFIKPGKRILGFNVYDYYSRIER